MTVAVARYPSGTSQITVESATGAIKLKGGINTKHNACNLAPVSVVGFGVEDTHISDSVLLIVASEPGRAWCQICNLGIGRHGLKILQNAEALNPATVAVFRAAS
ncbi:hypothetical protein AB7M49_004209 [Bradyrhizobium elkanii]